MESEFQPYVILFMNELVLLKNLFSRGKKTSLLSISVDKKGQRVIVTSECVFFFFFPKVDKI